MTKPENQQSKELTLQLNSPSRRELLAAVAGGAALGVLPGAAQAASAANKTNKAPSLVSPALGAAWDKYHASIAAARVAIENTPRFRNNPDHRAQAYYTLAETQAMAYNFAIAPRLNHPLVYTHTSWLTHFYTLGGNSADFLYGALYLDGKQTYRLTGRFGDLKLILMQVFNHLMGVPGSKSIGNYDFSDFALKPDGTFEVILSAEKQPGNWIQLDPTSDYNFILLRRALADWYQDSGELNITLLTEIKDYDEQSETALAKRIVIATHYLNFIVDKWTIGYYDRTLERNGGKKNVSALDPGAPQASELAGSPTSNYASAIYELKPDEALIAEVDVPNDAAYWSFQLYDVWLKSIDFVNNQANINLRRAVIDSDGKFRAVVSLTDPGIANWLDPVGRKEGHLCFRNYRSKLTPNPRLRLVKLADLSKYLPPETKTISPEERRKAIAYRQQGYRKMYYG